MMLLALANPFSGDEDIFIGVALLSGSKPYVDFFYPQPPLNLYVWAPIVSLFESHGFMALRLTSAVMGVAVLALVYVIQRQLDVERRIAIACSALLGCCYGFQYGSAVVRNDALPALLLAAGMLIAILAMRARLQAWLAWGEVALLLGLATSAKISYACPLAGAGLFVLVEFLRRRLSFGSVVAFSGGGLAGLAPCLLAWSAAPEAFVYGVFTYGMTAPIEWYRAIGMEWKFGWWAQLGGRLGSLALGRLWWRSH